jgi:hypothetical protein
MAAVESKRSDNLAPPAEEDLPMTNFEVIQKLSANFAAFIESTKVTVPPMLMTLLKDEKPAAKIAFLQRHVRMDQIDKLVREHAAANGITVDAEKIDKCVRYLKAMVEVATA